MSTCSIRFAAVFLVSLIFVIPGIFDTTMMSRLAIYPLAASLVLFSGRRNISRIHFILGSMLAFLPFFSLLWSSSPAGGLPFAVRWASFGLMVTGFSGSVREYGLRSHLPGLAAAGAVTALLLIFLGPDTLTGNANRAGMILVLGFTASLFLLRKDRPLLFLLPAAILTGAVFSSFYISWIACLAGTAGFLLRKRSGAVWRLLLILMAAGQFTASLFPEAAGRIGPTLEIRTRIWRNSARLFAEHLPLGTGFGSARLFILSSSEQELQVLAGENSRIDYLHSEPLALITETGIPGLLTMALMLYLILRKHRSYEVPALALAFWPVFAADLPLATPLGALPAALFLAMLPPLQEKKISLPLFIPVVLCAVSLFWGYLTLTGYRAFASHMQTGSAEDIERACSRLPWEERTYLAAGYIHFAEGSILSAMDYSERFIELYPESSRGWELYAMTLSAAGRENSSSAWAKAALLLPEQSVEPNGYLMFLNAIDTGGMNPDSALILASALNRVYENRDDLLPEMAPGDILAASQKLLFLTDICTGQHRDDLAAGIWANALKLALASDTEIPSELSIELLRNAELKEHLQGESGIMAEECLLLLQERLGMGTDQFPSP